MIVNRAEAEVLREELGEECPKLLVSAPVPLSPLLFHFDLGPRAGSTFGTYCPPVPFLPVGEPERERPLERLPPVVSPSWLALASSLVRAPDSVPHRHGS